MPGEEPKAQHYVHRAYLEGFQDPGMAKEGSSVLWLYLPNKSPLPQRPSRVARRNYYYCYDREQRRQFQIEHGLQQLEDAALPILRQLRRGEFSLQPDDRLTFAGYIALSHTRVPTFERLIDHLTKFGEAKRLEQLASDKRALKGVTDRLRAETGEDIDPDEFRQKLTGGSIEVKQSNREWTIRQMFEMTMRLQKVIWKMKWTFLLAPQGSDGFLTSDNPVGLFDPSHGPMRSVAFASSPEAHFTFPVDREVCLIATHSPKTDSIRLLNASGVRSVNSAMITRADSQLYAPFKSAAVQRLLDSHAAKRPRLKRILFKHGRVVEE